MGCLDKVKRNKILGGTFASELNPPDTEIFMNELTEVRK